MFAHSCGLLRLVWTVLPRTPAHGALRVLPAACPALHDGMVVFSAGTRADGYNRDVNDVQFDVSLHIIFSDSKKHDAYQAAPRHVEFANRNRPLWKSVRVFDSTVPR